MQTSIQSDWKLVPTVVASSNKECASDATSAGFPNHGLIVNADDWGRTAETTDRIFECFQLKALSSTSGMVFMADSERAARIARENNVDVGLHLNFTTPFSAANVSTHLLQAQARLTGYLRSSRLAQVFFHPGLSETFRSVLQAQVEEFWRLYGAVPERIDGHHHMHLSANVALSSLLPVGTIVRRSFSFQPGEKSALNRLYRKWLDARIAKRHRLTDYFFSIEPIEDVERLRRIADLAKSSLVELETHPVNEDEFRFLTGGHLFSHIGSINIASRYQVGKR